MGRRRKKGACQGTCMARRTPLIVPAFLLPGFAGVAVFTLIPFADVVRRSFALEGRGGFAGLSNYREVLESESFRLAAANTIRFILTAVPLLLAVSLGLAVLINGLGERARWCKTAFLMPMAVPVASVALIWRLFFQDAGLLNTAAERLGLEPVSYMDSGAAFFVLVFSYVWKNAGYDMILWLAGLEAIPGERYEAAAMDGAGRWQRFLHITLPGLRPVFMVIPTLSAVNSFKVFREAYLVSGAYPHTSIYLLQHIFNNWFMKLDMMKMCTAAVMLTAVVFGAAWMLEREGDGEDVEAKPKRRKTRAAEEIEGGKKVEGKRLGLNWFGAGRAAGCRLREERGGRSHRGRERDGPGG